MKKKLLLTAMALTLLLTSCSQSAPTDTPIVAPADTSTQEPEAVEPTHTPTPSVPPTEQAPFAGTASIWEIRNLIEGWGWGANKTLTVEVIAADGTQKETLTITTESGSLPPTEFSNDLVEGDLLTITVDDSHVTFPVLMPDVVADPEANTISGVGEPFAMIQVSVEHPRGSWIDLETWADSDGNFMIDFSSRVDWDANDQIQVGQFVGPTGVVWVRQDSPQLHVVLPPVEIDGFIVTTFSAPDNFVPTVNGTMLIDLDSDGDLDLFAAQTYWPPEPAPVLAFRNDGEGNFTDVTSEVFGEAAVEADSPRHWAVADFNGDGRDDLFLADQGLETGIFTGEDSPGGQNRLFIQNDAGQLIDETATRIPQMLDFTHNTSAGDIDGDGDIDIYVGNWDNPPAGPRFLINDRAGFFTDDKTRIPASIANAERPYSTCLLVDIDQDGDLDLFLGSPAMGIWGPDFTHDTLLLNNGAGRFNFAPDNGLPPRFDNGEEVEEVGTSSADFDQDGWPDLVIALQHVRGQDPNKKWIDPALQLLLNNGDGTFRDETSRIDQDWSAYIMPGHVGGDTLTIDWALIVDFNEDSWPDILTATFGVMSLLFENQDGTQFSVAENLGQLASLGNPEAVIPGDLDGDGDLDFVLLYSGSIQEVLLRK